MKFRSSPILVAALIAIAYSFSAVAENEFSPPVQEPTADPDQQDPIEEWNGFIADEFDNFRMRAGQQLSEGLWRAVDDIPIYNASNESFSAGVHLSRRVFDNHDVENTFTVVDFVSLDTGIPLWSHSFVSEGGGASAAKNLGLSFGTSQGINLIDVRRIKPDRIKDLPQLTKLKEEFGKFRNLIRNGEGGFALDNEIFSNEPVAKTAQAEETLAFDDPLRKARYGDFWNRLKFPVRLPLTPERFEKLNVGEILAYDLYGGIQLGLGGAITAGLDSFISPAFAGASASAYFRGNFRITVWREDEKLARVKVTRTKTNGRSAGFNSRGRDLVLLSDFLLLGLHVAAQTRKLIPLELNYNSFNAESLDVGYQYDLSQEAAREAYQLAVLGRFAYSDELSKQENKGVKHLFDREQDIDSESYAAHVNYFTIFSHTRSTSFSDSDAVISQNGEKHKVVKTDARNEKGWRTFWGMNESIAHSFRVNLDVDRYLRGDKDAFFLAAEGTIDDRGTDGEEMRRYALMVEKLVGESGIFPRLPIYRPETPEEIEARKSKEEGADGSPPIVVPRPLHEYGSSTFFYRLMFSQQQIEKFVEFPEEDIWPTLEKAFDIPEGEWQTPFKRHWQRIKAAPMILLDYLLFLFNQEVHESPKIFHASVIYDDWIAAKATVTINDKARAVGRLFVDNRYSQELIQLIRLVLQGEEIAFVVSGTNAATFGRIWKHGKSSEFGGTFPEIINRDIDFDNPELQAPLNLSYAIGDVSMQKTGASSYQLRFSTTQRPERIYIRLMEQSVWSGQKALVEYVIENQPGKFEFKKGINEIDFDLNSPMPWNHLAKIIEVDKRYTLGIASSGPDETWGPMATHNFRFKEKNTQRPRP